MHFSSSFQSDCWMLQNHNSFLYGSTRLTVRPGAQILSKSQFSTLDRVLVPKSRRQACAAHCVLNNNSVKQQNGTNFQSLFNNVIDKYCKNMQKIVYWK